jgi:hypothetical protein
MRVVLQKRAMKNSMASGAVAICSTPKGQHKVVLDSEQGLWGSLIAAALLYAAYTGPTGKPNACEHAV